MMKWMELWHKICSEDETCGHDAEPENHGAVSLPDTEGEVARTISSYLSLGLQLVGRCVYEYE